MNNDHSAVVLLSGGQDSATCLAIACKTYQTVYALGFHYGQRHLIELEQASLLAERAGVSFDVLSLDFFSQLGSNALIDAQLPIFSPEGEIPNTFVPGRNLFFLSAAAAWAMHRDAYALFIGACETDFSGYPDCRGEFIDSAQKTISLALDRPFEIKAPLMSLDKADIVLKMVDLGCLDWYLLTHTCYEGNRPACGVCPACLLRLKGFKKAGVVDPLDYSRPTDV